MGEYVRHIYRSLGMICLVGVLQADTLPTVSITGIDQDTHSGLVTVSYTLSASAIVTTDILLDGVPLGTNSLSFCEGDVMSRLDPGSHSFTWDPARAWPTAPDTVANLTFHVTAWDAATPPDVLVTDLRTGTTRYYPNLDALPGGITADRYKTVELVMRKIPGTAAGVWTMGSNHSGHDAKTAGNWAIESARSVRFTNDWYLGVYPVTQAQYRHVFGNWPDSFFTNIAARAKRPVEKYSYNAVRGGNWPTDLHDGAGGMIPTFRYKTGLFVDLPTEAQWEFSCRAGTTTLYNTGDTLTQDQGRYWLAGGKPSAAYPENLAAFDATDTASDSTGYLRWQMWTAGNGSPEVGSYDPNGFGLYDMHGGVYEFCLDWANTNVWDTTCVYTNPVGCLKSDSFYKGTTIARGGCWRDDVYSCRSSRRRLQGFTSTPGKSSVGIFGFRLAIPNIPPEPRTVSDAVTSQIRKQVRVTASGAQTALDARLVSTDSVEAAPFKTAPMGTLIFFR